MSSGAGNHCQTSVRIQLGNFVLSGGTAVPAIILALEAAGDVVVGTELVDVAIQNTPLNALCAKVKAAWARFPLRKSRVRAQSPLPIPSAVVQAVSVPGCPDRRRQLVCFHVTKVSASTWAPDLKLGQAWRFLERRINSCCSCCDETNTRQQPRLHLVGS